MELYGPGIKLCVGESTALSTGKNDGWTFWGRKQGCKLDPKGQNLGLSNKSGRGSIKIQSGVRKVKYRGWEIKWPLRGTWCLIWGWFQHHRSLEHFQGWPEFPQPHSAWQPWVLYLDSYMKPPLACWESPVTVLVRFPTNNWINKIRMKINRKSQQQNKEI